MGSTEQPQLSHQARSNFLRHAQKDENGESFMNEEDFINAVAPKQEDYVSHIGNHVNHVAKWEEKKTDWDLQSHSIRSNATSTGSCSMLPTDARPAS